MGLSSALCALALLLGVAIMLLVAGLGHAGFTPAIAEAVYLACLELVVITSIAVMFSALSTPVLSALYTLGLFLAGQWCDDLRAFAVHAPGGLRPLLEGIANLLPNLPLFNMRALAGSGTVTSATHLGLATLYAAVYSGRVLMLG